MREICVPSYSWIRMGKCSRDIMNLMLHLCKKHVQKWVLAFATDPVDYSIRRYFTQPVFWINATYTQGFLYKFSSSNYWRSHPIIKIKWACFIQVSDDAHSSVYRYYAMIYAKLFLQMCNVHHFDVFLFTKCLNAPRNRNN